MKPTFYSADWEQVRTANDYGMDKLLWIKFAAKSAVWQINLGRKSTMNNYRITSYTMLGVYFFMDTNLLPKNFSNIEKEIEFER